MMYYTLTPGMERGPRPLRICPRRITASFSSFLCVNIKDQTISYTAKIMLIQICYLLASTTSYHDYDIFSRSILLFLLLPWHLPNIVPSSEQNWHIRVSIYMNIWPLVDICRALIVYTPDNWYYLIKYSLLLHINM